MPTVRCPMCGTSLAYKEGDREIRCWRCGAAVVLQEKAGNGGQGSSQDSRSGFRISAILERGFLALEGREWEEADGFFERVLDQDAECAEVYLGKAMSALHIATKGEFERKYAAGKIGESSGLALARRFAEGELDSWFSELDRKKTEREEKERAEQKAREEETARAAERARAERAERVRQREEEIRRGMRSCQRLVAGNNFTAALQPDGTVEADGDNTCGQCEVRGWTEITAVAAGDLHTAGLKADGTVYTAGVDFEPSHAPATRWRNITAVAAGELHAVGLKADGTVVVAGENDSGQCEVGSWRDIAAVAAGGCQTAGLKSDGTVVAAGSSESGQCDVQDWTDIIAIAAGHDHTAGQRRDGTCVAVGSNCRQPEEEEPERESAAGGEWVDAEYSTRAEELNRHLAVHIDSDNRRSRRKLSENQKWKVVTVAAIAVLALVCAAVGLVDFLIANMGAS